jgi:hypothetical protein
MTAFTKPIKECFELPDEQDLEEECEQLIGMEGTQDFVVLADFLET